MSSGKKVKKKKGFPRIYRLIPIESESPFAHPSVGPLAETEEYLIQGSLHEHIIVSVPASMSHTSANKLMERLVEKFDRPVVVVTHNINFMKLEQLSREEVEAVTERVTARVVEEKLALAQLKELEADSDPTRDPEEADTQEGAGDSSEESVGDGDPPGGNGGGSGLRLVRGDHPGEGEAGGAPEGAVGEGGGDQEGGPKDSE